MFIFSLSACKRVADEDTAAPHDIDVNVTDFENSAENRDAETGENTDESAQSKVLNESLEQNSNENEAELKYQKVQNPEKDDPCNATLEDNFSEDEILVTIIKEYSRVRENFYSEDFPGVDVKKAKIIFSYSENTDNRVIVLITLNDSTKQKVLDSIKVLEQNPIVYRANPAYYVDVLSDYTEQGKDEKVFEEDKILAVIKETDTERKSYTAQDFPEIDVKDIQITADDMKISGVDAAFVTITIENGTKEKVFESIEKLKKNPIVLDAEPVYIE